jgi:hypothetical protein
MSVLEWILLWGGMVGSSGSDMSSLSSYEDITLVDESDGEKFQFFYSSGSVGRVPPDFVFPKMLLMTLITSWYVGNEGMNGAIQASAGKGDKEYKGVLQVIKNEKVDVCSGDCSKASGNMGCPFLERCMVFGSNSEAI